MKWSTPGYSKRAVNLAGKTLRDKLGNIYDMGRALDILDNWRSAHALPLNAIQMNLRNLAKNVCRRPLVAQRLKRTPSILAKLKRFDGMQLARMQDIGGCRAVVDNVREVKRLSLCFLHSRTRNQLVGQKDYVSQPKASGYRGVHLVYRYNSATNTDHHGLMVEIQLRSRLQHIWATGVETVGAFIRSPLKSSIGPEDWLRFFALLSSAFAMQERSPLVPGMPTDRNVLVQDLRGLNLRVGAVDRLETFGTLIKHLHTRRDPKERLFLMHLQPADGVTQVTGYRSNEVRKATDDYLETERNADADEGEDVVLVTADSLGALKRAYPNYFMDTKALVQRVRILLKFSDTSD